MCKVHGWRSRTCPECLYDQATATPHERKYPSRGIGKDALVLAMRLIDARPYQIRLLVLFATEYGYPAALTLARGWQNPMPLPVVICNFGLQEQT